MPFPMRQVRPSDLPKLLRNSVFLKQTPQDAARDAYGKLRTQTLRGRPGNAKTICLRMRHIQPVRARAVTVSSLVEAWMNRVVFLLCSFPGHLSLSSC